MIPPASAAATSVEPTNRMSSAFMERERLCVVAAAGGRLPFAGDPAYYPSHAKSAQQMPLRQTPYNQVRGRPHPMGMSLRALATVAIGVALIGTTQAQRSAPFDVVDESTITRTLTFAAGPSTQAPPSLRTSGRVVDVRNINGFIHVEGTNDAAVQLSIRKVIRGETRGAFDDAQRDVRLDFTDASPRLEAIVRDRSGHVCGEPWNQSGARWDRVHYEVRFDFTVRMPRDAALRLCTINGGDVLVNGTRGDFNVENVNGLIEMTGVAGSGRAHTVNGPVNRT